MPFRFRILVVIAFFAVLSVGVALVIGPADSPRPLVTAAEAAPAIVQPHRQTQLVNWIDLERWERAVAWNTAALPMQERLAWAAFHRPVVHVFNVTTTQPTAHSNHAPVASMSGASSGACGGDLPSCCIMNRESGGNPTAQNPVSTASGKWQFLTTTFDNVTGLTGPAKNYPVSVQDAAARKLWAGGAGAGAWAGDRC